MAYGMNERNARKVDHYLCENPARHIFGIRNGEGDWFSGFDCNGDPCFDADAREATTFADYKSAWCQWYLLERPNL